MGGKAGWEVLRHVLSVAPYAERGTDACKQRKQAFYPIEGAWRFRLQYASSSLIPAYLPTELMADIQKRLDKAEKYLSKGKQEDALEEYLAVLKDDPEQDAVRTTAADLCVSLGHGSQAAALLTELFDRLSAANDQAKAVVAFKKLSKAGTPTVDQTFKFAGYIEKSDKRTALDAYESAAKGFAAGGRKNDELSALKKITALDGSAANHQRLGELAETLCDGKSASAAYLKAGELDAANGAKWFERAYAQDASNAAAALQFARVLLPVNPQRVVQVLGPFANAEGASADAKQTYLLALLQERRTAEAEPLVWQLLEMRPERTEEAALMVGAYLASDEHGKAATFSRALDDKMSKRNARREFVTLMKETSAKHPPGVQFLEYLVEVYNSSNREQDYCEALINLFQLYYAQGNFLKAADSLDRCVEVDPYQSGNQQRLEMLRGKVDQNRLGAISNRLQTVGAVEAEEKEEKQVDEPTVLEDLVLQAEIFLQYSMRSKALERLERIHKLFPREEDKNEKVRSLYNNAGFFPKYEGPAPAAIPASAAAAGPTAAPMSPFGQSPSYGGAAAVGGTNAPGNAAVANGVATGPANGVPGASSFSSDENAVDNFARVTAITRNIYRQASVKAVLFATVNDVGRHFNASRCVAALMSPGKAPSAALEYCAPDVAKSDGQHLVKLLSAVQTIAMRQGMLRLDDTAKFAAEASLAVTVSTLQIRSLLAVALVDAGSEEQVGVLLLEQCEPRAWRDADSVVLKTIADQVLLAVNNAKLRNLMRDLAVTDERSGLLKRSSYIDVMLSETKRALSQNSTLSVLLFQFGKASAMVKEIGESAVESLVQQIGQQVCSHIRQNDMAVRYDLAAIAVILPDTTDKNSFFVVEKMRKVLAEAELGNGGRQIEVTVGIAEAVMRADFDPIDIVTEVINRAEAALEAAKAEGANSAKSLAPKMSVVAVA